MSMRVNCQNCGDLVEPDDVVRATEFGYEQLCPECASEITDYDWADIDDE